MLFSRYPIPTRAGKILNEHVEINAAEHCNLSCRSCSHLSPMMPRRLADAARVYQDLHDLASVYRAEFVSLLGGEPLLHPDLFSLIDAARRSGVADEVRMVTNGVLLPKMTEQCWAGLDEVRVSVYRGHELSMQEADHCRRMALRHRTRLRFEEHDSFFESHATLGTSDRGLVQDVYATCTIVHEWRCHLVSEGRFYKCPHTYFLAKTLGLDDDGGIPISSGRQFRARLVAYLRSPDPLPACAYCLGTAGRRFEQEQVPRRDFAATQRRPLEDLIDRDALAGAKRYL